MNRLHAHVLSILLLSGPVLAAETIDHDVLTEIRQEGIDRSEVKEILSYLTDVSGPRLTGSPGLARATEWARSRLEDWGMRNVQVEPWGDFGRGWSAEGYSVELLAPYYMRLIAYPEAWTSGTGGRLIGTPLRVRIEDEADFEEYQGKLKGKIILLGSDPELPRGFEPDSARFDERELEEIARAPLTGRRVSDERRREFRRQRELREKLRQFLRDEEVGAVLQAGRGRHGTLVVTGGGSHRVDEEPGIPSFRMAPEHFGLLTRLLEKDVEHQVAVESSVLFHEDDLQGYNLLAEIPGADERIGDEVVMMGAHIDSWHASTGATDNAAGSAVVLEAARILQTIGARPRRTIRIGLWSGEEQGLFGSREYVRKVFGTAEEGFTPAHDRFSAYFNMDNGTGRLRGIYLQGNAAARPIFESFIRPIHDLGVTTLTIRNTGGTDHVSFDSVGLPGFQFIQDPVAYRSRTHHTNMDLFEHVEEEDLRQAAVVLAYLVYSTAMRDERLPRKPAPRTRERE